MSLPRCPSGSEHPSQVQGARLRALWGSGSLRRLFLSHLRGLSTHQGRSHSPADPGHGRRLHATLANRRHTPRRPPRLAGKNARLLPRDASPHPGPPGSGHIKVLPSQTRRRLLCFTPTVSPIFHREPVQTLGCGGSRPGPTHPHGQTRPGTRSQAEGSRGGGGGRLRRQRGRPRGDG